MKKTTTDRKGAIALALALALVLGLAACGGPGADTGPIGITSPDAYAGAFTDVPGWCAEAADWAADKGVAAGYGNGVFGPNDPCTNAQIITMLWRAAGQPKAGKAFPGKTESYYQDAMNWAYSEGMVGATADPGFTCVRSGAMLLIWKAFGSPAASASTGFSDVPSAASYAKAVSWAVANGIAAGTGNGKFSPSDPCTRGQIVTLLHRAYVPGARLDANSAGSDTAADTQAEKTLSGYGTIQTLSKSVSKPSAADTGGKQATSYGTVDWSNAASGYAEFTASGAERVFILQNPDGQQAIFDVAKGKTVKLALTGGAGTYQYVIGRYTEDKSAYWADYKGSFTAGKMDAALAPYLVSTPYGDYAGAPNAARKAAELYDASKSQLDNVKAIAKYVGGLKYDKSLKQGNASVYVNPDTVIANGGGVCNEMAKLLVAMLRSQGIPAYCQGGTQGGESHAWVMAWAELSSYAQNGTTYSKGAWVLVEAVNGTVKTSSAASGYVPSSYAN